MSREITLAGYVLLFTGLVAQQLLAMRARSQQRPRRPLTFGELVLAFTGSAPLRLILLAGWLWIGWHLFARVDWR